jgi:hypothetical protein
MIKWYIIISIFLAICSGCQYNEFKSLHNPDGGWSLSGYNFHKKEQYNIKIGVTSLEDGLDTIEEDRHSSFQQKMVEKDKIMREGLYGVFVDIPF